MKPNQKAYKHQDTNIIISTPGLHSNPGFKVSKDLIRIVIFIDGSNVYHNLKKIFKNTKKLSDFNFGKFSKYLAGNYKLIKTYYYNSSLIKKKNPKKYAKQQRFFEKLRKTENFEVILGRMQKQIVDGKIVYVVKEDDIHLAVNMVKLAYKNIYDKAILISSDGDFVPAIKAVKETGKKIENIGFETKFSYHLKQECDNFKLLTKEILNQFFDEE